MTINGGLLSLFLPSIEQQEVMILFAINVITGAVFLYLFLFNRSERWKTFWAFVYTCFMFPGFAYLLTENLHYDEQLYFIPLLLSSVLSSMVLFVAGLVKVFFFDIRGSVPD
jgi:hypothetical protein